MAESDGCRAISVVVDTDRPTGRPIDERIFGKFSEHLRGAIYPGVYEDYLKNGSFEVWNTAGMGENMAGLVYPGVPEYRDIAFPWEPVVEAGTVTFEHVPGGGHGRYHDPDLDGGAEVPGSFRPTPSGVTAPRVQRIVVDGRGGVRQRVALPDFRTERFDVTVSTRGDGVESATVALRTPDGTVAAEASVPVAEDWGRYERRLHADTSGSPRYRDSSYGEYELAVTAAGTGHLDLDRALLMPADAVHGKFNPTTVELLREFDVTTIRWPGGNFASQYRWRDGVGPREERPVVPIVNWTGLEPNYLGTNEFLEFCELVEVDPYITVPYWSTLGPAEAAAWVEYCNGSTDTEMGALRTQHGYPEPWGVEHWSVGNEVWGHWQVGHADAASYAAGYREYHEAMRAADPDIEIDATGLDPWFTDVHDGSYADTRPGEPPVWNDVLLREAGDVIEGLDLHRYTVGLLGNDADRNAWLAATGEDPIGYNEILVNFPAVYDRLLDEVRELAADHGVPDVRLTVGEWNLGPRVNEGWPAASVGTMAHAIYAARMFQTLIRHGDAVRLAHWTDYTLYVHPRPDGTLPPHPGAYVQREMAEPFREANGEWRRLETAVDDAPTRPFRKTGTWSLPSDDVPLVDAVSLGGPDGSVLTFVTNGSLTERYAVDVDYGTFDGGVTVVRYSGADGDPFAAHRRWDGRTGVSVETFSASTDGGPVRVVMPPASFAKISVDA